MVSGKPAESGGRFSYPSRGGLLMRLLHTSDWHLGRTVGNGPRSGPAMSDFDAVLAEITGIARDTQPDLIVHSGDLFDSYRPAPGDLARCLRALGTCPRSRRSW